MYFYFIHPPSVLNAYIMNVKNRFIEYNIAAVEQQHIFIKRCGDPCKSCMLSQGAKKIIIIVTNVEKAFFKVKRK